jgi:hypothetical protein
MAPSRGGRRPMTQRVRQQGERKRADEEPQGEGSGMPEEVSETTTPPLRRAGNRFECSEELGVSRRLRGHVGHHAYGASQEWLFRGCHIDLLCPSRDYCQVWQSPRVSRAEPSSLERPRRTGRTSSVSRAAALASSPWGLVDTITRAPFSRVSYNQRYRIQNPRLFLNRGTYSRHRHRNIVI